MAYKKDCGGFMTNKNRFYDRISQSFRSKLRRKGYVYQVEGWWSGYSNYNPATKTPRCRFFTFEKPNLIESHVFSDNTYLHFRVEKIKYIPRMEIKVINNYLSVLEKCAL